MASYLLAYHGGGMPQSKEEQDKVMAAWDAWYSGLGDSVVDGGNPIGQSVMIASDGSTTPGGGVNPVSGYTIIKADSLDRAVEVSRNCPILASGGTVEVGETFSMM